MEEMVGPLSTCCRELLWGWWRQIGLMVSFIILTVSVWNILDTASYIPIFYRIIGNRCLIWLWETSNDFTFNFVNVNVINISQRWLNFLSFK
jgi:hypothetical protein